MPSTLCDVCVSLYSRCNSVIHWPREYRHACSAYIWCCIQSTAITSLQPQQHSASQTVKGGQRVAVMRWRMPYVDEFTDPVSRTANNVPMWPRLTRSDRPRRPLMSSCLGPHLLFIVPASLSTQITPISPHWLPVTYLYLNPKNIITCSYYPGQHIWSIHLKGNVHLDKILVT